MSASGLLEQLKLKTAFTKLIVLLLRKQNILCSLRCALITIDCQSFVFIDCHQWLSGFIVANVQLQVYFSCSEFLNVFCFFLVLICFMMDMSKNIVKRLTYQMKTHAFICKTFRINFSSRVLLEMKLYTIV